jgi:SAM-dependent methyltransferase
MELPVADAESLKAAVRERYGATALTVLSGGSCCGPSSSSCDNPITGNLYDDAEKGLIPAEAVQASLGCGNPTALVDLRPGETVLDLGSGGGIDVLLSARRVGPSGRVYGLDMTDEMLALARENARKAGATNVEFLKGDIEHIPLPDGSVDVIISNCVVNLAPDKGQVLREAFRVLKPGGRFAVSDIVVLGEVPAEIRRSAELWMGCIAGAPEAATFKRLLTEAGFAGADVEPTRVYTVDAVRAELEAMRVPMEGLAEQVDGKFAAAFIRARKPDPQECVTLRPARGADWPSVERLLQADRLPLEGVPADLAHFTVAETARDGVIAAAGVELYGQSALLRSTVVERTWRGSGVGRMVVEAVLDTARDAGARDVYLLTTTAADYFPKFGFRCVDRSEIPAAVRGSAEFTGACPASATGMHRGL